MAPGSNRKGRSRKRKTAGEEGEIGSAAAADGTTTPSENEDSKKVKSDIPAASSSPAVAAASASGVSKNNNLPCSKLVLLLSPAKTLDTSSNHSTVGQPIPWTMPTGDKAKINQLIRVMKQHAKDAPSLGKLLGISAKLAQTAKEYWDRMELYAYGDDDEVATTPNSPGTKPAIFAFQGAAYQGLEADTLDDNDLLYLQQSLRIIDPVYGWLRPMDVMQPYRLEMATKDIWKNLQTAKCPAKLSEYWKPAIQDAIQDEANHVGLVNLASDEYSAAIDSTKNDMTKVVFRHNGKVVAVHAKRARGLMVRYCAKHKVERVAELQGFDMEGYRYQPKESNDTTLVFDRPANWESAKTE